MEQRLISGTLKCANKLCDGRVRNIYQESTTSLAPAQMPVNSPNAMIKKTLGTYPAR